MSRGALEFPLSSDPVYQVWLAAHCRSGGDVERLRRTVTDFADLPLVSVILTACDPSPRLLEEAIDSVRRQVYFRWELCVVDDGSRDPDVRRVLDRQAREDSRTRVVERASPGGIVAALNRGLELATGEVVAFLGAEDLLAPDALYEVVALLNRHPGADLIYSDEDRVDHEGLLSGPMFKPDWCPDSFLSRMYTGRLSAYRRLTVERIGGFRAGYEGGHDYDLALRLTEQTSEIHHVPKILYHARTQAKSSEGAVQGDAGVFEAEKRALQDAIDRRGEPGQVAHVPGHLGCYVVRYKIRRPQLVSIVIPSRDHGGMLHACLESIFTRTTWPVFEIVVVDNGSVETRAKEVFAHWREREPERFRCLLLDIPFNFSTLCNYGAEQARGDILLFLNNDTEVVTPDWLQAMLEQAQRPSVGAVGALLLYENGTIQHAGAILGLGGLAAHSHRGCPSTSPGYMHQVVTVNNYSSVAGTCLMCRREAFDQVGRFDEALPGDYEDVDLCLKLCRAGHRNVYVPHVRLFHYESVSRGTDYVEREPAQRAHATAFILRKWRDVVDHDPCYNPNLTRTREDHGLRIEHVPVAVDRRDLELKGFLCSIDEIQIVAGTCLKIRGWAAVWNGSPVERVSLEVGGPAGGSWREDARLGYERADVLAEHALQSSRVGFAFTRRAAEPFPARLTIRVTLFDGRGRSESYAITPATDPRTSASPSAAMRAFDRISAAVLSKAVGGFLRLLPGLPDFRPSGPGAALVELVRHAAARHRLGGLLAGLGRLAPALSDRLGLDVPLTRDIAYRGWLWREYPRRRQLLEQRRAVAELSYRPTISVIMPVFNIEARYLSAAIDSVRRQTYPNWELCIADDSSTRPHVRPLVEQAARRDPRIRPVFRARNGNISAASNSALEVATGAYVAQLDHDDLLAPHALQEAVTLLNLHPEADFIYSDEDKIDLDGIHSQPFFKPAWSPETFLSKMYTCHFAVYRKSLIDEIGGFRSEFDGAEDYDLVLRLVERTDRIFRVPSVLYHWRMHPDSTATGARDVKPWAYEAGVNALREAVGRRGEPGTVSRVAGTIGFFEVRHHLRARDLVSVVILARHGPGPLGRCLLSVFETSTYQNFEVIVVEGNDVDADTRRVLDEWQARRPGRCSSLRVEAPFSWSRWCNAGAARARGPFLLFLGDDTEVVSPDWIEGLMEQAQRPAIGAVGGQLLHRDHTIEHAGVVVGIAGTAGFAHRGAPAIASGHFGRINTVGNVSAVTGACLACRRAVFETVGGFDPAFDPAYGDVDFCLKLLQRQLRNVYLPYVKLYHLESARSASRGDGRELSAASAMFRSKWAHVIDDDPCYSPNLTRSAEDYGVGSLAGRRVPLVEGDRSASRARLGP